MSTDFRNLKPYRDYQRAQMLARRLLALQLLVIVGFVLYGLVFWYLQVVQGPEYRRRAEENRLRRRVETPLRGLVRDRHGEIMVSNRPSFSVFLDRQRARDPRLTVMRLCTFLEIPAEPLLERLERGASRPRFLPLRLLPDVGLELAARIEAHRPEFPGIDVAQESKRFYPLGASAAHVVGYISEADEGEVSQREDVLPGDRVGRIGVERAFDEMLRGQPGLVLEEVNAQGRSLAEVATERRARHGPPLRTTLDAEMQRDLAELFDGRAGAAVFLDPRSGALRALYSGPSYDPNLFSGRLTAEVWNSLRDDPRRPLQNRALAGTYSPGSTFKIMVAAAALEEGVVTPEDEIFCGGIKRFYGQPRHCHRRGGHGKVALRTAIEKSCNIYFYTVGQQLELPPIRRMAESFGLGRPTGLALTAEATGLVPSNEWKLRSQGEPWYPGETISVAIGQGPLHVTPMQMAVASAVIANGGYRVQPFVRTRDALRFQREPVGLSPETVAGLTEAMAKVVESGTARRSKLEGIPFAGKTGTAQVVALDAEEDPGDHAWFIGFGPLPDPTLAWAVLVEHGGHGGESAAPIAAEVLRRAVEREAGLGPGDTQLAREGRDADGA
jgi:penicillin-binding protein 2